MSYVCVKHARLGLGGMHLCAFLHRNAIWTAWCTHEQESSRSICKIFPPCRDVTLETRRVWLQLFEREWLFVCFDNGWWQAVHYHHRELFCKIITFKTCFLHVVSSPDLIRHVHAHCGWFWVWDRDSAKTKHIWKEMKAGSCWELNPGHIWLEPPVLCHWATTAGQPPTLTILYMYCS